MIASPARDVRTGARWLPAAVGLAGIAAIVAGHALAASRPADEASPLVIATHLYALVLLAGLLWLAAGTGQVLLRWIGLKPESRLERLLLATALGLGCVGYAVLGLGLAGLAVLARHDLILLLREAPALLRAVLAARQQLRAREPGLARALPILELFGVVLLITALAPPTANDVLAYHMQAPKHFLQLGRIAPVWDIGDANMPFTIDMLYLLGLAFGSDELAGVLHLSMVALVCAAIYAFGRRYLSERAGWIAAIAFVSTGIVQVFGTVPNVEYGLTLFDFLAVYAFFRWRESQDRRWLALSGGLVGFALGTKYFALFTAATLGLWMLWLGFRSRSRLGWSGAAVLVLTFALPAGLIALPWYLKNLLWFGNPVWPYLAPDPDDFNLLLTATMKYPGGLWGSTMLPVWLFTQGSREYPMIRPPLELLVLPLYLLLPKRRIVTTLLVLGAIQFTFWSTGAHVLRYLTQGLPALCLVAAYVLDRLMSSPRFRGLGRTAVPGLVIVALLFPAIIATVLVIAVGQVHQLVGLESRQAYLERSVDNHGIVARLNERPEDVRGVLMIGDRRGFYLDVPHWTDVSLKAFQAIALAPDASAARAYLAQRDMSHVLVNRTDLLWFVPYDPERRLIGWLRQFEATRAGYLEVVETHRGITLYRVVDRDPD